MTLLARPDTIFEANFFNSTDGQSWTNLSDYVELQEGLSISRRRQVVFDEVGSGSLTIFLNNSDGTFNNARVDKPYYGLLTVDVPVRARARWPRCPTDTVNMLSADESISALADFYYAEQGSLDKEAATSYVNQGAPIDNTYFIVSTADAANIFVGQQMQATPTSIDDESTINIFDETSTPIFDEYTRDDVFTVTAISAPSGGFVNISVTPSFADIAVIGDTYNTITTSLIWDTGVIQNTASIHLLTGDFAARSADEEDPIYVLPSTQYSGRIQVKDDTAGTGISFQVKGCIVWYDSEGNYISESQGSAVTLTTSYQNVDITATSPSNAYTARLGIVSNTLVNPSSAAISVTGYTKDAVNRGGLYTHLTVPKEANVGDLAIVTLHVNAQPTFTVPAGWTTIDTWNDGFGKSLTARKILTQADIGLRTQWAINQTGKRWIATMTTYSGVNQAAPINAHATASETNFQTGHTTPSITTTVANCWLFHGVFDTSSTTTVWTTPVGITGRIFDYCVGGNAATGVVGDNAAPVASGAHAGVSFSSNVKSKYVGMTQIGIAPATGTGPDSVQVNLGSWQLEQGASPSAFNEGGRWKDLFTGLTDSWTKTWSGELSLMQIAATDRTKQLNLDNVGSATYETILQHSPVAYYILNETGGNTVTEAANSSLTPQAAMVGVQHGTGGTLGWGNGIGPSVDAQPAVTITKLTKLDCAIPTVTLTNPVTGATDITITFWWSSTDTDTSGNLILTNITSKDIGKTETAYLRIFGFSGTHIDAQAYVSSESNSCLATATQSTNYFDGKPHLITAVFSLTGSQLVSSLYVDGDFKTTNSVASTFTVFPNMLIAAVGGTSTSGSLITSGTYSHWAVFDQALSDEDISNLYDAGNTAFAGDTVDQRIGRLCDWANLDGFDLDQSITLCDRHLPDTQTVLAAIQQAARTDGGTSFINDSGEVAFRTRSRREGPDDPWMTVSAQYLDQSINEITDDQLLVNQATIKRMGANAIQISNDLDSQAVHGVVNRDVETIQQNPDDAKYNGEYLTAFYGEPKERCDSVMIDAIFLNQWPVLWAQDMWNILRITNLPAIEASTTRDFYIEGWQYQIDDQSWIITYDTSAVIPFAVLNDDASGVVGDVVVAW